LSIDLRDSIRRLKPQRVLARTQGFQRHQRKECLNDALIFLTAAKAGLPVLTADRDQFDLIQQLAPAGQFVHY
jgi:hypothetical protein